MLDSATMIVLDGGVAIDTTVNRTGGVFVSAGGTAVNTLMSGGSMVIACGGTATALQLNAGGCLGGIAFAEGETSENPNTGENKQGSLNLGSLPER